MGSCPIDTLFWVSGWFMVGLFKRYRTLLRVIYIKFIKLFSYYYMCILCCVLFLFLLYRVPYVYRPFMFSVFLMVAVFARFVSLFFSRIFNKFNVFFSGFIPVGTPIYICPLVCVAERISYIIRPIVLVLRPFINISLGCFGAVAVGDLCFSGRLIWFLMLLVLFFYEVFVAVVHWYIVGSILSFSVAH